jgi:hypothetical protein
VFRKAKYMIDGDILLNRKNGLLQKCWFPLYGLISYPR